MFYGSIVNRSININVIYYQRLIYVSDAGENIHTVNLWSNTGNLVAGNLVASISL